MSEESPDVEVKPEEVEAPVEADQEAPADVEVEAVEVAEAPAPAEPTEPEAEYREEDYEAFFERFKTAEEEALPEWEAYDEEAESPGAQFTFRRTPPPMFGNRQGVPYYVAGRVLDDPGRADKDVKEDLLSRSLRVNPLDGFMKVIRSMHDDKPRSLRDQVVENQANLYMNNFVMPLLTGWSRGAKMTRGDFVKMLIKKRVSLGEYLYNSGLLDSAIKDFSIRSALTIVRPFLKLSLDAVKNEVGVSWWLSRIQMSDPHLFTIIQTTPGGSQWLERSLLDLFKLVKGRYA